MNVAHITTLILKTGEELQRNFIWITVNWKEGLICHLHSSKCMGCREASSRDILIPSKCMHISLLGRREFIQGFLLIVSFQTKWEVIMFTLQDICAGNHTWIGSVHFSLVHITFDCWKKQIFLLFPDLSLRILFLYIAFNTFKEIIVFNARWLWNKEVSSLLCFSLKFEVLFNRNGTMTACTMNTIEVSHRS